MRNECQFILVHRQSSQQWDGGIKLPLSMEKSFLMVLSLYTIVSLCWVSAWLILLHHYSRIAGMPYWTWLIFGKFLVTCALSVNSLSGVTHICINNQTIIGSDNGLLPGQHQATISTNARILLIGPSGTNLWNFSRNCCIFIQETAFENVVWRMVILSRLQCIK